ncbi:MAG: hypothetical protein BWZ10_03526 [candidate division BRC1 bacterium ADurb.BinA364]|nr:MAG: hypothetical protein BWZ10_03526 [candidate division BRC1 bacterium ADurb.BinA364]
MALVAAFPGMTRAGLLREIAQELDAEPEDGLRASVNSYIQAIQAEITRLNRRGLKCVLIIDEAHFLCANSLNLLRSFGNIELPDRKLATILLFGENEFLRRLEHSSLKDFFGRIFERVELKPLTRDEVAQYIKFRCLMAGGGPSLFSNEIFGEIFRLSGGVPREVNRICRIAMDRAACRGSMRVDLAALE